MSPIITTEKLARWSASKPRTVIGIWVVALLLFGAITGMFLASSLTTTFDFTGMPDSKKADKLLEQRLRGPRPINEIVLVQSTTQTVDSPEFRHVVTDVLARINALGPTIVANSISYYQAPNTSLVSQDRKTTMVPITMTGTQDEASKNIGELQDAIRGYGPPPGFDVVQTGVASIGQDFQHISEQDLQKGETVGGLVALVVLILVFGTLVAAVLPVILAVVSIVIAMGLTAIVGQFFDLTFFVTNMVVMIGLAVGIDYCLFIVHRYREERGKGSEKVDAIATAGNTASRAVLFSGATVVLALVGMLLIPTTVFRSLGTGAILVVTVAVLASLTLLPALLGLLGDKVDRLSIPMLKPTHSANSTGERRGFWDRVAQTVMARPVVSLILSGGLLIAMAVPYFSINTGATGVESFPKEIESKRGFDILQDKFSSGQVSPIEVVVDGQVNTPAVQQSIQRFLAAVQTDPAFGPAQPTQVNLTGDLALISFPLAHETDSRAAAEQVNRLRENIIPAAFAGVPADVVVGGEPAFNLDFFNISDRAVLPVFAFVLSMSFLLLMLVFRSLVVPLKATILNLMSVGAAYGLIVLVFQKGIGADLLGFQQVATIEAWLPLFLFSVLFGLSMDYHVFLLSRIREQYDRTGDNAGSVAFGIHSTGRLITGAALIMVVVFAGFASGRLVMLQQMGFGLAVAVIMDATVIRMVMVPAGMKLLGKANWWLPSWLNWLPDLRVEPAVSKPSHGPVISGRVASKRR